MALVFSLSAPITRDRIEAVLGDDIAVWQVTLRSPHNDFLHTRRQLSEFRQLLRPLIDHIKAAHGQETPLNVFPAMPVAMAVELGRIRQPKAVMPWRIFDQNNAKGGFSFALSIPPEVTNER